MKSVCLFTFQVVNTTSKELSDVAVEVSVWDLEGMCPYYKVTEKISVPPKNVLETAEMDYPKMKNAKPVYFLLLKLFRLSDKGILSRNFYWLHLPGSDYQLLKLYRKRKVPLEITSNVLITGSSYKIQMHIQNMSKESKKLLATNNCQLIDDGSEGLEMPTRHEVGGMFSRIFKGSCFDNGVKRVVETGGTDTGVAFFLHLSVHDAKKVEKTAGEDTRILPVHYSDNYFSLVPGEKTTVTLSYEVPQGVTPRVTLDGWNYHKKQLV